MKIICVFVSVTLYFSLLYSFVYSPTFGAWIVIKLYMLIIYLLVGFYRTK